MNDDTARRLEAWFDDQLPPAGRAEVEALLRSDPVARAHIGRLQLMRDALQSGHRQPADPAPAWGELERRLAAGTQRPARRPLRFPVVWGAAAAVMLAGMSLWWVLRAGIATEGDHAAGFASSVESVETDLVGATAIVYLDRPSGWTVVWVVEAEVPGRG